MSVYYMLKKKNTSNKSYRVDIRLSKTKGCVLNLGRQLIEAEWKVFYKKRALTGVRSAATISNFLVC